MRAYLFDLDGTLSDSGEAIARSLNQALQHNGLDPIDRSTLPQFIGPPLQDSIDQLLDERALDARLVDPIIETYRERYGVLSITHAALYPGIAAMLDRVKLHAAIGIVTAKPLRYAEPLLDALGILDVMTVICGPRSDEAEPKTVTLSRALHLLNVPPGRVAMVGDRRHDVEAGLATGTFTIGVTWGFGDRAELAGAGAHRIVDRPDHIGR